MSRLSDSEFVTALRAVLGLDPLPGARGPSSSPIAEVPISVSSDGNDLEWPSFQWFNQQRRRRKHANPR